MSLLCWLFGHDFPVKYVTEYYTELHGKCSRCRIVAVDKDEIAYCTDCGHALSMNSLSRHKVFRKIASPFYTKSRDQYVATHQEDS